ncbi:MAG TPA: FHA domain-containing protein [Gemmataceae bacterium]|nr:FHA domain-containing protein [Gemmataceae bacterium]
MPDPRLNSIHLDPPRRQEYRRARAALLGARGWQTLAAEQQQGADGSDGPPNTVLQSTDRPPPGLKFWLADKQDVYPLKTGLNTIGRAPENDVVVEDPYVSRRHCAILVHAGDGCELHDTASKNGTYLNGRRLAAPTLLRPGDEIRMCDRSFVFLGHSDEEGHPAHSPTLTE